MSITLFIIVLTVAISIFGIQNQSVQAKLQFNPYLVKHAKQWHRSITHAFVHAGWLHLFVNMWVLWNFGGGVEAYFEAYRGSMVLPLYLILYTGGILCSTLPSYLRHQDNFNYNAVGASGAVSAVLFSAIYFQPTLGIYVMFIPIAIPAFVIGPLYLAYEWYQHRNSNDNVAHDAHFWGAAFGFVITVVMIPQQFTMFIKEIANYIGHI
jgi:membrane associated rhomboid family serine protease